MEPMIPQELMSDKSNKIYMCGNSLPEKPLVE
jgi:hypothetical protein